MALRGWLQQEVASVARPRTTRGRARWSREMECLTSGDDTCKIRGSGGVGCTDKGVVMLNYTTVVLYPVIKYPLSFLI